MAGPDPIDARRASDEAFLRTWLFDRDEPCPLCGYNLRGLTIPRCPECWQALRLSVSLAEPYLKAWIALIAGLLPPAGVGAVIMALFCFVALPEEGFDRCMRELERMNPMQVLSAAQVVLSVPISVMAIVMRRRFLQWKRPSQIACALTAWSAILLNGLFVLSQMR